MEPRQQPGTVKDRRWSQRYRNRLAWGLAFVATFAYASYAIINTNVEVRHGCERLAGLRDVTYSVLNGAERSLGQQAMAADDPKQAKLLRGRRQEYSDYIVRLDRQVKPYLADDPASPMDIDCEKAYPRPFPLSLLD